MVKGTLKPSTRLTPYEKRSLGPWWRLTCASVAGAAPPAPLHSRRPPQSPVRQEKWFWLGAVGASPDPTRPGLGRGGEGAVGEGGEVEAAALEDGVAGVGLDAGPEGEGAVVYQSQKGCRGSGVGERAEDQECGEEEARELLW
ncbi:hypothetical protein Pyn_18879 [Prunus yedoensis var. nudiflora]|uniref:Uncharacterized protein n=1 Tax=Prunus yedoensis var. nudiflora TaxID=2094558 RepID=A0A314YDU3_PRUYE|nr:hypothetical protein Pyn_18879 [Prunus yedoensis var. nudiflora]